MPTPIAVSASAAAAITAPRTTHPSPSIASIIGSTSSGPITRAAEADIPKTAWYCAGFVLGMVEKARCQVPAPPVTSPTVSRTTPPTIRATDQSLETSDADANNTHPEKRPTDPIAVDRAAWASVWIRRPRPSG